MAAADEIHGDAGNDTIIGGPGQDNLFGESGADFLDGSGPVPAGLDTCDAGGDFGDIEQRPDRRLLRPRDVAMPLHRSDGPVGRGIDLEQLRETGHLAVLLEVQFAHLATKGDVLLAGDVLVSKEQHLVLQPGGANRSHLRVVHTAEVHTPNLGSNGRLFEVAQLAEFGWYRPSKLVALQAHVREVRELSQLARDRTRELVGVQPQVGQLANLGGQGPHIELRHEGAQPGELADSATELLHWCLAVRIGDGERRHVATFAADPVPIAGVVEGSSPSWWTCPHTPSRGDSADAQPAALPPRTRWLRGCRVGSRHPHRPSRPPPRPCRIDASVQGRPERSFNPRVNAVKGWVGAGLATRVLRQTAAFVGQAAKQWGDLPVRATQGLGVVLDLVGDFLEAHGVGPEHWTTGVHRPAVAVDPHHIDIAAANGDAFFEDLGALVDHWIQRALKDFLVAYFALGAALAFGKLADELLDLGVGGLGTRLGVVGVVTPAVLLAASAALAHDVADGVTGCCLLAPANVEASKVAHRERAHRQAEVVDDIVHLGRCCAFHQHAVALGAAHEQHAVANEPVAHANQRGGLADALAGGHRRRNDLLGRGVAAHDLHQFHHVGGGEEVHADDTLGARGCRGDLVDVQRRGVAGQHGAGLTDGVQLGEDGLLQIHVLEHGLDNHVAVGEVVLVG
ncbi:hypothetical protein GQR58_030034 [Nymphon striatum]|nr:hypothetical protein GQR58_030034 [Nymphon striatum]